MKVTDHWKRHLTSPLNLYLFSDGQEVAVVYLRALYTPDDLKSENVSLKGTSIYQAEFSESIDVFFIFYMYLFQDETSIRTETKENSPCSFYLRSAAHKAVLYFRVLWKMLKDTSNCTCLAEYQNLLKLTQIFLNFLYDTRGIFPKIYEFIM